MLLLGNAFLWLMFAGFDWFALPSNGHEVQVRIPVWSVGNVVSQFSNYVNSGSDKNQKKKEKYKPQDPTPPPPPPPYPYPYPPPHYHYPPYPHPWTKPTTTTTTPTTNPTEPSGLSPSEYSLCETFPHLPICQEIRSVHLEENDNSIPTVLSESPELGSEQQLQQLTITSEAHSVSSLCFHYAQLCRKPEEAQFVRLTDGQGKPLLLIYPAAEAEYPLALGKSFSVMSKPTRRPSWQGNLPKELLTSQNNEP